MNIENLIHNLNQEQKQAVLSDSKFLIIKAGAGTGKTSALTKRIARLSSLGEPHRVVAMTFTRKAANEMKERVYDNLDTEDKPFIGTMHSFCYKLIVKNKHLLNIQEQILIALTNEIHDVMQMAVNNIHGELDKDEGGKEIFQKEMNTIMRWKENGLTLQDIEKQNIDNFPNELIDSIQVYKEYQKLMLERNLMDPSDLTLNAIYLLENNEDIKNNVNNYIQHLLVDEFQDTNQSQIRLLKLLIGKDTTFTCVGDDDQSLYSFRGSIPNLMEKVESLLNIYKHPFEVIKLFTNYRCTDNVLKVANLMVDYNPRSEPKILNSGRNGDDIVVSGFATAKQEAKDIIKKMKALNKRGKGTPWNEMAILCRLNKPLNLMETELLTAKIPYKLLSGQTFVTKMEIIDILSYLHLAVHPELDVAFYRIAGKPARKIGPAMADKITETMKEHNVSIMQAVDIMIDKKQISGKITIENIKKFTDQIQWLHDGYKDGAEISDLIAFILDEIDYKSHLSKQDNFETKLDIVETLKTVSEKYGDKLDDFLVDLSLANSDELMDNAVTLGTIHGSKGLEWDEVFIMAFEEGNLPFSRNNQPMWNNNPWDITDMSGIEEEARIAHVAITRSKQHTHISYAIDRYPGQSSKPSHFLKERGELNYPKVEAKHLEARRKWAQRNRPF